jgi:hypothetical protein
MKEKPIMKEGNEIQAKINNFALNTNKIPYVAYIIHSVLWGVLIFLYIFQRSRIVSIYEYWWFVFIVILMASLTYYDFFNDVGYMIGKWWYNA